MLHGNLLLHGWQLSDVSFYTTELPQYLLIERFIGLAPDVVHVAAAMTYTVLVLLAVMLAKAKAAGREAIAGCLLAAGIMAAPQVGNGVYVLLGSPDHVGSAVPVLVTFLLLDRAPGAGTRSRAAGAILCLAVIADGIALYTGVLPVVIVCAVRVYYRRRTAVSKLALGAAAIGRPGWPISCSRRSGRRRVHALAGTASTGRAR